MSDFEYTPPPASKIVIEFYEAYGWERYDEESQSRCADWLHAMYPGADYVIVPENGYPSFHWYPESEEKMMWWMLKYA